jgi:predicted alpha-1,6-mannanase (GH76 family)
MRRRAAPAGLIRGPLPRNPAVTISAVALAVVVTMLAALTGSGPLGSVNSLRAGMSVLFSSYGADTGLIGGSWWQAAVALSTIETYAQVTGDMTYDSAIAGAYALNSGGNFENGSDDDTAWWALAWLQAYELTRVPAYLAIAETDADYIHQDWDGTCGGGVWWQRNPRSYKNAITNELFLDLTASLHNEIPADVKYLSWARAEWSWFDHSGLINASNLINDGLDGSCANNADVTWTYNQGVILAGLAQLYQATGNRSLLRIAERIATAAIGQLTSGGVLAEPCEGGGCRARLDANTRSFKGIFVTDLKALAITAGTTQFNSFLSRQAQSIEAHDTSSHHEFGMFWAGPVGGVSSSSQASALDSLVASVRLPQPHGHDHDARPSGHTLG